MPARTWLVNSSIVPAPSVTQIGFADVFVVRDVLGVARHHDTPGLDHIGLVGEFERELGVLLDDQDRHLVLAVDLAEDPEEIAHDQRRKPEGWRGRSISARATASICCSPPESVPACWVCRCLSTG